MITYKILIIDDAFFIRNLIKKAVGKKPIKDDVKFEVAGETDDIANGLDMCYDLNPDIITLDYTFTESESNGLELAKYIKEKYPQIPILIISANSEPDFPEKIKEIGCHFLPKPFQEAYLWIRLDNIAKEIQSYQPVENSKNEILEETKELLKEISTEVEAEIEEQHFEIEEIKLPKVSNPTKSKPKPQPQPIKKNVKDDLFGLELDTMQIKPNKTNEVKPEIKLEIKKDDVKIGVIKKDTIIENNKKVSDNIIKEKTPINIPIEKPVEIHVEPKNEVIIDEFEEIEDFFVETEEPLIIEDGKNIIVVEDENEVIIHQDEPEQIVTKDAYVPEESFDDNIFDNVEDFIVDTTDINNSNLNEESIKNNRVQSLLDSLSYSYQNEMAYALNYVEQIRRPEAFETVVEVKENKYEKEIASFVPIEQTVESFDETFDKLFAEFNPDINMDVFNTPPKEDRETIKHDLLKDGPSISSQIEIAPPIDEKVRRLYSDEKKEQVMEEFIAQTEEKPKESVFTKIFKAFNKK